jgi:CelD/BcsL family acetyltransferase involved in cellulose biosynthesis
VLSGESLFSELETDWKELVAGSTTATPFQTYEWTSTWWKHFGTFKHPQAVAIYDGDDLVGLFPTVLTAGVWRTLRPMGMGASDYLHPLARSGYEDRVNQAVTAYLREVKVDLIDLHQVREDRASFGETLGGDQVEQATCLVLDLPSSYDDYLATIGKSLRYDVKKLDKMVFKEGKARIDRVPHGETQRGLDYLFELHKARWRKRRLPGAFLAGTMRFHREWAELAQRQGWLWLSVLRLEDRPIGAIYAMNLGLTTYYYQAGFDPDQGAVSPGTLLVASSIRRSIDEGTQRFDFLRGDEGYKRRWKPQHEYKNFRTISPGQSALGRLGSKWNAMGFKVESRIRARLEGRGLV